MASGHGDARKQMQSMNIKCITSPCCCVQLFPANIHVEKNADVNLRQRLGCRRSAVRQCTQTQSACKVILTTWQTPSWYVRTHLLNTPIQQVKKDVVRHHVRYVRQGSSVQLWQYYSLSPDDVNELDTFYQQKNVTNVDQGFSDLIEWDVYLQKTAVPGSAGRTPGAGVETLPMRRREFK